MPTLRLHLMGDFLLYLGDTPITTVNTPRLQALLAYLVLHRSAPQPRRRLAFLLWPDSSERQARTNLRNLIHLLRRALPDIDRFLQIDGLMLQWRADAPWALDVADFEQALAQAEQAGDTPASRAAIELAVERYRGDLLPNCYDDWIVPERERLRVQLLDALERLILAFEAERAYPAAIRCAQRLLRYDPLHEAIYRHLIHLHALSGDHAGALRVYQTCVTVLKRELDIAPSPETQAAYAHLAHMNVAALPPHTPPALPDAPPHNLPAFLTSFVGRSRELADMKHVLAGTGGNSPPVRLLTLTGAGGSGKTRLAVAAATELVAMFPDGVWLVELATLTDPALVPQAVAMVLHVREEAQRPLITTLVDALRSKASLLVLDNCEHLIAAAAAMAQTLLNACPRLRILATSREALGIAGERTWLVPSLALPDPQRAAGEPGLTHILMRSEAVQLFVERAATALPTFTLTNANAPAVSQICRRLDGIPLALELAAARVKIISVTQLAARLDDCFQLLVGGSRTALPRHRTLRAAIDWSYDLLSTPEQTLFTRLSVFAGGWTLDAAEAVCADFGAPILDFGLGAEAEPIQNPKRPEGTRIRNTEVLELLAHLAEKSLVAVDTQLAGEARYRLLETIQQYALEQLTASGTAHLVQGQHMAYYLAFAEAAEPQLRGDQQAIWLERLDHDLDNLRAAFHWALNHGQAEIAGRICVALLRLWDTHSHISEGQQWLDRTLALLDVAHLDTEPHGGTHPPDQRQAMRVRLRAKALNGAGTIANDRGDYDQATAFYEESLALQRVLNEPAGMATVLNNLAQVAQLQGDATRAIRLYEESLGLFRELGDRWAVATLLNNLGTLSWTQGEYARAYALYQESLTLRRQLRIRWGSPHRWSILARSPTRRAMIPERMTLSPRDWGSSVRLATRSISRSRSPISGSSRS